MGDATPAGEAELRAAHCELFESSMRSEAGRLMTFQQWPDNSPVSPQDLAKAGFFFVGPRDIVQCFCCGGVLQDWEPGNCPTAMHLEFFPSCKFICGEDVGNQELPPLRQIFDTVDGQFLSLLQGIDSEEPALPNEPEYPEMIREEMRLSTFQNWPRYTDMHPEQLARAGFFYTGQGDVVRCFHCDGRIRNWLLGDDPWREHAKWYPECEFLLRSKGREFVNHVQESFANTPLSPRHSWYRTEQDSSASRDLLWNWELQALHPPNLFGIVQEGFAHTRVADVRLISYMIILDFYLSIFELIFDPLQPEWGEGSSAEESRNIAQRETETSSSREEMESLQQKESEESQVSTEEQLRRLREERMCKVCMDRDVSVVFVPCGHLVACEECASNLRSCPICRAVIRGCVRTFMS